MALIALVLTLALEQWRALPVPNLVYKVLRLLANWTERNLNAGQRRHGFYGWLLLVVGSGLVVGLVHTLLNSMSWFLGLAFTVAILYLTLGFRQFSHRFTEIQLALASSDLHGAQAQLTRWKQAYEPG